MDGFLGTNMPRLGMGCWAIGGPFFAGDAPLGYAEANDAVSIRTIHAALDAGVRLFDTADVYGGGHSEALLGQALQGHDEAVIVSKFGLTFDPETKQATGPNPNPAYVTVAVERSLKRLARERVDVMLLHLNSLAVDEAEPIFVALEHLRQDGKIGAYGWSTDFPASAAAFADRPGFVAVEHATNLFVDVPSMQRVIEDANLWSLNRSPLAMGVLTGKFGAGATMRDDDIRRNNFDWMDYFKDGAVAPRFLKNLEAVREALQTGGRSLAQGAIAWLWSRSERNIPIPGARTLEQIQENAGAMAFGPLPASAMAEIERLITRDPEGPPRER